MSSTPPPPASFDAFAIDPRLSQAVQALGFDLPTPIQTAAIPALLSGRDVIGRARTGSGKTAAFGLPLLERVKEGGKDVRALVLTPTRELALQVTEALRSYAKNLPIRIVTVYGGAPYGPQLRALSEGVAVVVGTPGRILDHLDRGALVLSSLAVLVLDEADEMLRMGFLEDVERVLAAAPPERQIALFSATMPEPIKRIADNYLREPVLVQVELEELTTVHIEQRGLVVPDRFKLDALARVLAAEPTGATLVFARTRAGCAEAATYLAERGFSVEALHGDLNQAARELVLTRLRAKRLDVVVATDVAARGLDVEHLTRVINLDLPNDPESYVHRIGRTGRAGRAGVAISLITPRELTRIRFFERILGAKIAAVDPPSDADIQRARRNVLRDAVREQVHDDKDGCSALAAELSRDLDPHQALAAALRVLAADRGLDLKGVADERPPAWSRAAKPAKPAKGAHAPAAHAPPASPDEIELFLPVGAARGVRPADLVGALANELGIPGKEIGRITIAPHKSFVRLPREIGEALLSQVKSLSIRGNDVPIGLARPRDDARPGAHAGNDRPKPFKARPLENAKSKKSFRHPRGR